MNLEEKFKLRASLFGPTVRGRHPSLSSSFTAPYRMYVYLVSLGYYSLPKKSVVCEDSNDPMISNSSSNTPTERAGRRPMCDKGIIGVAGGECHE